MSSETSTVRFFDPGRAYRQRKEAYDTEIQRVLNAGDLILRKDVEDFEANFAKFCGKKYAVALNSGTDALYLSLWALGIGPGDEVIVPSHTFVATAQVVAQLGATPVLVDMGDDWHKKLTDKTKAIIPAHIAGEVLDWHTNIEWLHVIEDACQALGAQGVGFGKTQCYSFYPAKILGAFGDAGAITTDDEDLYEEIKELRGHYKKDYSKWGINSRMDNLQAAILNIKLHHMPETLADRDFISAKYASRLHRTRIELPKNTDGRVWQDYIIRIPSRLSPDMPHHNSYRDELYEHLKSRGIETMKNDYPMPIGKLPKAAQYEAETLRLPINEVLYESEVEAVIEAINEFYAE